MIGDEETDPLNGSPEPFTEAQFSAFSLFERMTLEQALDVFAHAMRKIYNRRFVVQYVELDEDVDTLDPVPVDDPNEEDDDPRATVPVGWRRNEEVEE